MAGKRRKSGRVEPVLDSRSRDDGILGFGLTETDRPGGGAPAPTQDAKPKPRKGGRASAKKRKGDAGAPAAVPSAASRWLVRRTAYWAAVFAIIGTAGLAALVAYYWAKLPPTSEWSAAGAAGECAHRRRQWRADHQSRRQRRRDPDARRDAALPAARR